MHAPWFFRPARRRPACAVAVAGCLCLAALAVRAQAPSGPAPVTPPATPPAGAASAAAAGPAPASSAPASVVPAGAAEPAASAPTRSAPVRATAPAGSAPPPLVVHNLHFGDVLFHFYQEDYFPSLTSLMVSQHFARMPYHEADAELLRGGLLLSYGLHREAGAIFAQLIQQGAAPAVRDRAWYYLAKIRYQRGLLAEAEDSLARVENHLPPALEEDRQLLLAHLLMARADPAGAAEVLRKLADSSSAGPYARYNLGVALLRAGEAKQGIQVLEELGRAPAQGEEFQALRDQANVALGFAALQDQRPEAARRYLERVRLSGMLSSRALLGFGWAAAALKLPKVALVPWTELLERRPVDAAVLEARLAVPFAYAELGAYAQSLDRYHRAIASYEQESTALDESIAAIRAGRLLQGLLERNPDSRMGWFWHVGDLPEMPHGGHLTHLLAQHEFQEAFKNYRDLQFLAHNLQEWADHLGVFDAMLATRQQGYAERLPEVRERSQADRLGPLQRRRDELAAQLERVAADADASALADGRQQDLLARLASVRATLEQSPGDPELATARERHRLAAGALTWELTEAFPQRLWEARKALRDIDAGLEQARQYDTALARAQRDEPARHAAFAQRIAGLRERLQALLPRVAALSREQQHEVQELAVAALVRQKERLADYITQARFAVAQLYDRAHVTRTDDRASKP
jgi:hypothetical protein